MIDFIKRFLEADTNAQTGSGTGGTRDPRVAACALLIEMANADNRFSQEEWDHIMGTLTGPFALSKEDAAELARVAQKELDESIDLWQFTNLINQTYNKQEKTEVVEVIWGLVYADGYLSDHENYLMHKLGKMLKLTNRELINAKLRVLQERGDSS